MVLEKRIKVKPRDMDEGMYRLAAEICPTCGCSWSVKQFKRGETSE